MDSTTPPTPEQDDELSKILYAFADYIRHHEKTGLGGPHNQTWAESKIKAWRNAYAERKVVEALEANDANT